MLDVLYEDNHIIVVVKPQNMLTQGDSSGDPDILSEVKQYIKEKYNKPGEAFVGLVHRLDRPTGGVMVFAKTSKAANRLSRSIREGEFTKKYFAIVHGDNLKQSDTLTHYLVKDVRANVVRIAPPLVEGAKECKLKYDVLASTNNMSLVSVELFTGRSHQIRVQMAAIKHPLVGDKKYGVEDKSPRLALFASDLSFPHPTTKQILRFHVVPEYDKSPWNMFDKNFYNTNI